MPSCELELPDNWLAHPVFHPEKLKKYYWDYDGPHPLDSVSIETRTIERVLAARHFDNGQKQVLIKWKDHNPVFNCWIDIDDDLRQRLALDRPEPTTLPFSSRTLLEAGVTE